MGDRAGNFAVQNADLLLAVGTRISIRQTGYDFKTWARAAKVVMVDIDRAEMKKYTIHVDKAVWADAKDFLGCLLRRAENFPPSPERTLGEANVYAFIDALSSRLAENSLTAVSNGACCVAGHQAYVIKKGTRFIINNAIASMGYGLPAAIGLCIAGGRRSTVCLEGDGSIMMNLQELQTIVTNRLPIKIFLITQNNLFGHHTKVGIGPESGDLSFPDFEKIARAFGYPYRKIVCNGDFSVIGEVLGEEGYAFCEVFTDTKQVWEPKSSVKRLPDGTLVSPPLEDLAPFLPREELEELMEIPLIEE